MSGPLPFFLCRFQTCQLPSARFDELMGYPDDLGARRAIEDAHVSAHSSTLPPCQKQ